jgi:hypothetical protein
MRNCAWKACEGEAHSNAFIDNCMICLPNWGQYPVCPDCGTRLRVKSGAKTGFCWGCVNPAGVTCKRFTLNRIEDKESSQ